jgi:hypothetical protein
MRRRRICGTCFEINGQERAMVRLTMMMWSIAGTVLAGVAIVAVLAVPSLASHAMSYIPYAAFGGFIAALPVAYFVARQLDRSPASAAGHK